MPRRANLMEHDSGALMRTRLSLVLAFSLAAGCAPAVPDVAESAPDSDPLLDCARDGGISLALPWAESNGLGDWHVMRVVQQDVIWLEAAQVSQGSQQMEFWVGVLVCRDGEPDVTWSVSDAWTTVSGSADEVLVSTTKLGATGWTGPAQRQRYSLLGEPIGEPVPSIREEGGALWHRVGDRWSAVSGSHHPDKTEILLGQLDAEARDLGVVETWSARSGFGGTWLGGAESEVRWYERGSDSTRILAGRGLDGVVLAELPGVGVGRGEPGSDWSYFFDSEERSWLVHLDGRMKAVTLDFESDRIRYDDGGHWLARPHRMEWLPEGASEPTVLLEDAEHVLVDVQLFGDGLAAGLWMPEPGRDSDAVIRFHSR